MSFHSKIGASSAHRWMACPGSVRLSAGVESKSSEFAQEGTLAHALAEVCLTNEWPAEQLAGLPLSYDDHGEKKVADITEEMAENVQVYLDAVRGLGGELLVEQRFHLKQIHNDLFGTSDAIVWNAKTKTLYVYDLKYGQGVPVEVEDNPQLPYYALGALLETKYPAETIVMGIVQPRCPHPDGPIRTKTIPAIDLLDFADDLQKAALATEVPNAPLNPGGHCHWCPAAGFCPAIAAKAQDVAKAEFRADLSYSPEVLAETLRWLPILEAWINSVREFAYGESEHGRAPPGWKLVEKVARRKWREDDSVVVSRLLENTPLTQDELYAPAKLLTPAALEKLLPKDQRGVINELTIKESSGLALAPEADRRPAVKADAATEFSNA